MSVEGNTKQVCEMATDCVYPTKNKLYGVMLIRGINHSHDDKFRHYLDIVLYLSIWPSLSIPESTTIAH